MQNRARTHAGTTPAACRACCSTCCQFACRLVRPCRPPCSVARYALGRLPLVPPCDAGLRAFPACLPRSSLAGLRGTVVCWWPALISGLAQFEIRPLDRVPGLTITRASACAFTNTEAGQVSHLAAPTFTGVSQHVRMLTAASVLPPVSPGCPALVVGYHADLPGAC